MVIKDKAVDTTNPAVGLSAGSRVLRTKGVKSIVNTSVERGRIWAFAWPCIVLISTLFLLQMEGQTATNAKTHAQTFLDEIDNSVSLSSDGFAGPR